MQFDIIDISQEELAKLKPAQMTLLRKAQQEKDKLYSQFEKTVQVFEEKLLSAGVYNSSLLMSKVGALQGEFNHQAALIADNLVYNMSLIDLKDDGGGKNDEQTEQTGYLVDYSLSYNERYVIVRNYYLAIKDRDVRMAKYGKDETAKKYLGTYYNTLYNILATYEDT